MRRTLTLYTHTWSRYKCLSVDRVERERKECRKWVAMSSAKARMKCSNSLPTDQLFNNVFVNLSFVVRGEWTTLAPRTILNRFSIIFHDEKVYFIDWIWWSGWSLTFDAIENITTNAFMAEKKTFRRLSLMHPNWIKQKWQRNGENVISNHKLRRCRRHQETSHQLFLSVPPPVLVRHISFVFGNVHVE